MASGPPRERQREERAALIVSVAQDVLADKGYYDALIDEIAARAGIARGTVYLHFASEEDLLVARRVTLEQRDTYSKQASYAAWISRRTSPGKRLDVRTKCCYSLT